MVSIEIFKKETVKIPILLYALILLFFNVLDVFGLVYINPFVETYNIFVLVILSVLYLFYINNKINYSLFIMFLVITITVNLSCVLFLQTHVIYRTMWIVALTPFVFLYAGRKIGSFFAVYFILFVIMCYADGLLKEIFLQDLFVYVFSNILIASISYFFVLNLEEYTKNIQNRHETLKTQAVTDSLTDVYNRRGFFNKIRNKKGVLGIFDLDDFKCVNDKYGHKFGDEYMKFFVNMLKDNTRKNDIIGRIGGDEFVVFFEGASVTDIKNWVVKFYKELDKKTFHNLKISVSSGFSEYNGSINESFLEADKKLYMSKKVKNTFTF